MLFISFVQPQKKFTYQIESYKGIPWISPSEIKGAVPIPSKWFDTTPLLMNNLNQKSEP